MGKELIGRLKEASISILPIVVLIIILNFSSKDIAFDGSSATNGMGPIFASFLISIIPLIVGMALFNMGAEKSMGQIGEIVGTTLTKRKSLILLAIVALLMGTLTTMAEPDLTVLSLRLLPEGSNWIFIVVVSLGVGILLMVAVFRVIFQKSLKIWLIIAYGLVFALGCLADKNFFTIVFDSGGVTTGPVSVPFIIALGVGVATVRGGKNPEDDAFGYSGLCSLGPLISVMILCAFLSNNAGISNIEGNIENQVSDMFSTLSSYGEIGSLYLNNFLSALREVSLSMSPIVVFFVFYNFFLKIKGPKLWSIIIGLFYTFIGLVFFLMGANSGFITVASSLGKSFGHLSIYLFLGIGFVIGCLIILAEPAVHVLAEQVSEVSRGVIKKSTIYIALCLATGLAVLLNIIRVRFSIPLVYFIVVVYIITFVMCFFVPDIYVAIAFDSSGVATGTLSSCFLLPMFIGYTNTLYEQGVYGDITLGAAMLENGFGIIGMVSTMPLIAIELVGLIGVIKTKTAYKKALESVREPDDSQIIHLPSVMGA
jgi:hypothetical protein